MTITTLIILTACAAIALLILKISLKAKKTKQYQYTAKKIMTDNENEMFNLLQNTFPEMTIFAQVSMTSIIDGKNFASHSTIARMSVDFVLLDKQRNIIAAIEIDDKSHERPDRRKADKTKNEAFNQSGTKLIRWKASPHPSAAKMLKDVHQ